MLTSRELKRLLSHLLCLVCCVLLQNVYGFERLSAEDYESQRCFRRGTEPPADIKKISIGGIFGSAEAAALFREAVSRVNLDINRILPSDYCLAATTVVLGSQGTMMQVKAICDELMSNRNYVIVLGDLRSDSGTIPITPTYISTYYQIPLISLGDYTEDAMMLREVHSSILRLQPHRAHEVEVWCVLLSRLGVTHATMITPDDVTGGEYERYMRHCWWQGDVIQYVRFMHLSPHSKPVHYAELVDAIWRDNYGVVLLYADGDQAAMLFEKAKQQNITGAGWIWIVSEFAGQAPNVPIGSLVIRNEKLPQQTLIDESVTIIAYSFAAMLNSSAKSSLEQAMPPLHCRDSADEGPWIKEGKRIFSYLNRALYINYTSKVAVAFDPQGYRLISSYSVLNVRPRTVRQVGTYNEGLQYLEEDSFDSPLAVHDASAEEFTDRAAAFGLFTLINAKTEHYYTLHIDDADIDTSTHSVAEAIQKRIYNVSRESRNVETVRQNMLTFNQSTVYWPGGGPLRVHREPRRWHLRAVTVESIPFVYVFRNTENLTMHFIERTYAAQQHLKEEHTHLQPDATNAGADDTLVCPGLKCTYSAPNSTEIFDYCCFGYSIDLLISVAQAINITFDLHLVGDGSFGKQVDESDEASDEAIIPTEDGDPRRGFSWTGMMGELERDEADAIIAPLSINGKRSKAVIFTKPYYFPSFGILVRKLSKQPTLGSFMQPFDTSLWLLIFVMVNAAAAFMYFIERFSPLAWYRSHSLSTPIIPEFMGKWLPPGTKNQHPKSQFNEVKTGEDSQLTFAEATWLSWGIVLSTGPGEKLPNSFSTRVFTMIWAGVAMILVASYTANLAALLVLDQPDGSISIDDAKFRNPSIEFNFTTVRDSDVAQHIRRNVELDTMYRFMQSRLLERVEDGINFVKNGTLDAFLWETARLMQEEANDCNLMVAPGTFGKSHYAIAMRKELAHVSSYDWQASKLEKNSSASSKVESATRKIDSIVEKISREIVRMHDSGRMEVLNEFWIFSKLEDVVDTRIVKDMQHFRFQNEKEPECPEEHSSDSTLGLDNVLDLFFLIFAGSAIAGVILIGEVAYHRRRVHNKQSR